MNLYKLSLLVFFLFIALAFSAEEQKTPQQQQPAPPPTQQQKQAPQPPKEEPKSQPPPPQQQPIVDENAEKVKKELSLKNKEVEQLRQELDSRNKELAQLKEKLQKDVQHLNDQITKKEQENRQLEDSVKKVLSTSALSDDKLRAKDQQIDSKTKEGEHLKRNLADLNAKLEQLKASSKSQQQNGQIPEPLECARLHFENAREKAVPVMEKAKAHFHTICHEACQFTDRVKAEVDKHAGPQLRELEKHMAPHLEEIEKQLAPHRTQFQKQAAEIIHEVEVQATEYEKQAVVFVSAQLAQHYPEAKPYAPQIVRYTAIYILVILLGIPALVLLRLFFKIFCFCCCCGCCSSSSPSSSSSAPQKGAVNQKPTNTPAKKVEESPKKTGQDKKPKK